MLGVLGLTDGKGGMDEFDSMMHTGPLRGSLARRMGLSEFAKNGCAQLGSPGCAWCRMAQYIPRTHCDPPDECPACKHRDRCPCGNEAFKRALSGHMEGATM